MALKEAQQGLFVGCDERKVLVPESKSTPSFLRQGSLAVSQLVSARIQRPPAIRTSPTTSGPDHCLATAAGTGFHLARASSFLLDWLRIVPGPYFE